MTSPGRYHLLLTTSGRPVQHGWWASGETARRKLVGWIGAVGNMPEPQITLTDEETGTALATWPTES
ncbi:hypothetical protein [Streptomyces sp. NPDC007856]|uniref:hypothetical protein n=1 Tax=Streptomyces sp. NPDC007856 TaxID=3364781 RepID=UPI00368D8053